MNKYFCLLLLIFPLMGLAQLEPIASEVYHWKRPSTNMEINYRASVLFEGSAHDMEWLQVNAGQLIPSETKNMFVVPDNEEYLLIIKAGTLLVTLRDSVHEITGGSIALLMPGEIFHLQNEQKTACEFYWMKYRSKLPPDMDRGKNAGGSIVKSWYKIDFKPHDKGGIRNYFERPTAMSKRFEMHVTTLKAGIKSHEPHIHRAEEIVLMIDGNTEMQIGQRFFKGKMVLYFISDQMFRMLSVMKELIHVCISLFNLNKKYE